MSLQDAYGNNTLLMSQSSASDDDGDPPPHANKVCNLTLTQLIAQGKAHNTGTIKGYTNHLERFYTKLHEYINSLPEDERQNFQYLVPPYDDYHWFADRPAIRKALKLVTPEICVCPTVTAIRGTLRPIEQLFSLHKPEQEEHCHNSRSSQYAPTQSYTQKEEDHWVNLKDPTKHVKTYKYAHKLAELHKKRRACKPQAGFPAMALGSESRRQKAH